MLQVLEEGEPFGFPSLISGNRPHADVVAEEDSVLLRLPGAVFYKLMEEPRFADFFVTGLADRLRRTASGADGRRCPATWRCRWTPWSPGRRCSPTPPSTSPRRRGG